jgi:YihY family inner membrane protein
VFLKRALWRLGSGLLPTFRYWMHTEVHVFGLAIAASVLLSFYPFLIVMISLCRYALRWPQAEGAIYFALRDYFPGEVGDFLVRNLWVSVRSPVEFLSILLLLFTANGIFEPLEVALNRAWGVATDRSFWRNQIISLGLIFACGALAMISIVLTAFNRDILPAQFGILGAASELARVAVYKAAAIPISVLTLLLVFWLLPNRRIPIRDVFPAAVVVGLALEFLKYVHLLIWPWLFAKIEREYGVFRNSVTILLWSFLASLIVLAGAEWTGRRHRGRADAAPHLN